MANSSGSNEFKELRRLGIRGALLLLPFLLLPLVELFVLPIDFFTFRVWEAALASPYRHPGPYYPNLHVKKDKEYGDHYREGDPAKVQAKPVEWFTDAYGWRNRSEIAKLEKYDVIVLGDSNIVGSFLDQKDMLAEVADARSNKTVYSYSYGSDHISLYFSDSRMKKKSGDLLVIESKVGNWATTQDYLHNFREMSDGSLDVVDRSAEFASNYDAPSRNPFLEKIESRLTKQAMFHWLKASLATNFEVPMRNKNELFIGGKGAVSGAGGTIWRPLNWVVENGAFKPLPDDLQPALTIRALGPNAYWHIERFVSDRPDGKIVVRFEAKNSVVPSRHRVYIFEDGSYRSVGEFVVGSDWRTFEIPITTNQGSILEFQIDQPDAWQWLSIRDFQVIGGAALPLKNKTAVVIPMATWAGEAMPCAETC